MLDGTRLVIVQGDTSSALGGALAAARAGVPIAHVEAGLRSHDPLRPWPEEEFRIAIDREADLLFAPTELSAANLRREGVPGQVFVTGNTGADAALERIALLRPAGNDSDGRKTLLVTCHRRESWGKGVEAISEALTGIASTADVRLLVVLHPNPRVAGEMRRLLCGHSGIELRHACGHLEMLQLMRESDLVLSDSGGMQEEAATLGVPLLVLRDRTERPEAIASGNMRLVGTEPSRIVAVVTSLLGDEIAIERMRRPSLAYGDGRAAERIAAIIEDWLGRPQRPLVTPTGLEPVFSP